MRNFSHRNNTGEILERSAWWQLDEGLELGLGLEFD